MRQVGKVRRIIEYCLSIYYIMTKKQNYTSNVSTCVLCMDVWLAIDFTKEIIL